MRAGTVSYGTFLGLASPVAAEVIAAAGANWLLLDLEHGAATEDHIGPTVVASGGYGVPTIVRTESGERIRIGRALDLGAAGVMVPRIETPEEVRDVVRSFHFPPTGNRGVASYNRAARWGMDPSAMSSQSAAAVIIQIETIKALENLEKIASVEGVHMLFVGPLDLSYSLGIPRAFGSEEFETALRKVVAEARKNNISAGILAPTAEAARRYRDLGFTFIAIASDSVLLANIFSSTIHELKEQTHD
ncbi:MAG: HpcH/HpaI aldolase family protein [Microbacteriaceae bacterium]